MMCRRHNFCVLSAAALSYVITTAGVAVCVCGVTLWAETRLHLLSIFCVEFNWKSRESNEGNPVRWIAVTVIVL
jgi:hypothetical protein